MIYVLLRYKTSNKVLAEALSPILLCGWHLLIVPHLETAHHCLLIHLLPCSGLAQKLLTAHAMGKFRWDFSNFIPVPRETPQILNTSSCF